MENMDKLLDCLNLDSGFFYNSLTISMEEFSIQKKNVQNELKQFSFAKNIHENN